MRQYTVKLLFGLAFAILSWFGGTAHAQANLGDTVHVSCSGLIGYQSACAKLMAEFEKNCTALGGTTSYSNWDGDDFFFFGYMDVDLTCKGPTEALASASSCGPLIDQWRAALNQDYPSVPISSDVVAAAAGITTTANGNLQQGQTCDPLVDECDQTQNLVCTEGPTLVFTCQPRVPSPDSALSTTAKSAP